MALTEAEELELLELELQLQKEKVRSEASARKRTDPVRVSANAAAGINEVANDILTFIPDTIAAGAQVLSGRGGEPFEGAPDTIFGEAAEKIQPRNTQERVARQGGRFTGEALGAAALAPVAVPAQGLNAASRARLLSTPGIVSGAKLAADDIVNFLTSFPGRAFAEETGLSFLAGLGSGLVAELGGGTAQQVAGGVGAASGPAVLSRVSPVGAAVRFGQGLQSKISRDAAARQAKEEIRTLLGDELTPGATANIEEAQQLEKEIPGLELSLAEQSEAPALVATQRQLESAASGAELELMTLRQRNNALAVQQFVENSGPQGIPSPDFIVDEVVQSVSKSADALETEAISLQGERESLAGTVPQADRTAKGVKLRTKLQEARSAKAEEMSKVASRLGIMDVDVTDEFSLWARGVLDEFGTQSRLSDKTLPPVLTNLKEELGKSGDFTFADIKALRERLGSEIRSTMKNPEANADDVRKMVISKEKLDDLIDNLGSSGAVPQDLVERYEAFRRLYKAEFVDRFETGVSFRARKKGLGDVFSTSDEKVGELFFKPGGITEARQFKAAFEGDQEALDALESVILDKMREAVVKDGVLNETALKNWLRKHDSVLSEFPSIKNKIKNIKSANEEILGRQADLKTRQKFLQTRALVTRLDSLAKGRGTSEQILEAAMRNPAVLEDILKRIKGSPEAVNGLKRWVWDQAASGSSQDVRNFIFDNEGLLSSLLGNEHLDNLKTIQRARAKVELIPEAQGQASRFQTIDDVLQQKAGSSVSSITGRIINVQRGRSNKLTEGSVVLARLLDAKKRAEADALMKEALYQPEVAKLLAAEVQGGKLPEPIKRKLNFWLFQIGAEPFREE